ncbi:hypothetical protein [Ruegeria jejuensis]|uniref:hypothetical protein n=1 Tax=Ruegeria jejuensis TaxID=3233338 RepID=UPI00355B0AEE
MIEAHDVRTVWVVYKNTDDIEGRGRQYISNVCELEATALRIGRGKYVMGSNCPIKAVTSYRIDGQWYQPSPVVPASDEDKGVQKKIDTERSVSGRAAKAIEAAQKMGLSRDHIEALQEAIPTAK